MMSRYWHNRSLCSILEEMRECNKTRNYSYLLGLIEEAQSMADRMEAALADVRDIDKMQEERRELRAQIKKDKSLKGV